MMMMMMMMMTRPHSYSSSSIHLYMCIHNVTYSPQIITVNCYIYVVCPGMIRVRTTRWCMLYKQEMRRQSAEIIATELHVSVL